MIGEVKKISLSCIPMLAQDQIPTMAFDPNMLTGYYNSITISPQ